MMKSRLLIISHGHPNFNVGGAEVAANRYYKEMRDHFDCISLSRHFDPNYRGKNLIKLYTSSEYLFIQNKTSNYDHFLQEASLDKNDELELKNFLQNIKPDVIHFHHFLFLGINLFRKIKNWLPDVKLILSLHEFVLICLNNGQMVTRNENKLCYEANEFSCSKCFNNGGYENFYVRKYFIFSREIVRP